ncbi:predicted protein [Nematostella vectensis]|uniref:Cytochrome b-245 light chain n=1 Tax=Nematostella vectensis TaxID=45351 RepID=A7SI83_NEMVE|nr:cytochrome b-245 light chain [Nematostella vectensis]EDO36606.1 predicted protein [Nematostella vectensis]|eukprot:XP_001628669.1 predicted protein [Nematostella vectensis]
MGHTEWAMWANEQGVITSFVLALGGTLGVAGMFKKYEFGAYSIALGVLVFLIEYPRGKRKQGKKTQERSYQRCLTRLVSGLGIVGRNYYIRFVFYLLSCIPCCFFLPTILGGFSLFFTSIIYLCAALSGEKWQPCLDSKADRTPGINPSHHPTVPPPRNPRSQSLDNLGVSSSSVNRV